MARTKTKAGSKKVRYNAIFAAREHGLIKNFNQLENWRNTLGLFVRGRDNWTSIGSGELMVVSRRRRYVHTESIGLNDNMRRKGHGIHLYFAMIRAAKSIGAQRIYSSRSLNKYSGNMWCNKLREFFDVQGPREAKKCKCGCRACRRRWGRYYIDLTKLSLRSIPR